MHKILVLAIGLSFCGGTSHAFNVDEWAPVEGDSSTNVGTVAEQQMRAAFRKHLQKIEAMPLRSLRVVSYMKALSSLCDDTEMLPLERLLWANIAREEIEKRLVAETGISLNELNKSLPRAPGAFDGDAEMAATADAAQLVRTFSMENLDDMEEAGTKIYQFMERSLPDLLTIDKVTVPTGFDMAAHSQMVEELLTVYMNKAQTTLGKSYKRRKREVIALATTLGVVCVGALVTGGLLYTTLFKK